MSTDDGSSRDGRDGSAPSQDRWSSREPQADHASQSAPTPGKTTLVEAELLGAGPPRQRKVGHRSLIEQEHGDRNAVQRRSAGVGAAMPANVQAKMEGSFDSNFSAVRIHEGPQASSLGALAYTQGTDIHFAPGQYQPHSTSGQELLGHELAHVVQQSQGRVATATQTKGGNINADPALEREADDMGAAAARGEQVRPSHGALSPSHASVSSAPIQRKEVVPANVTGAEVEKEGGGTATSATVNKAIEAYMVTGTNVASLVVTIKSWAVPEEMEKILPRAKQSDVAAAAPLLGADLDAFDKLATRLTAMGDGGMEPSRFFCNQVETLVSNGGKGMPPSKFVEILLGLPAKTLKLINPTKEMGTREFTPSEDAVAAPEVDEHMETICGRYDVISRKASASTRRAGAIHEVDLALMPRVKGIADIKGSIDDGGKVTIESGQAERAFAIGYLGAMTFEGELSNQGGERFYGTLFAKGWLSAFSQDVRKAKDGGTAREPGAEDFAKQEFRDGDVTIRIANGMVFLVRAEGSTTDEGQVTVHMDRNSLLFGGKPMIQFIRDAVVGVVEFDKDGKVVHLRTY